MSDGPSKPMQAGWAHRLLMATAAPIAAVLFALIVSGLVLAVAGSDPIGTIRLMLDNGLKLETIVDALNRATPLFLSGIAAAIGFRMNLFNIGVEGQYTLAAFLAAALGATISLPGALHIAAIVLIAMFVGAFWAGLAGVLKVHRGVNEVISTIMLNYIALGVVAALLPRFLSESNSASQGTEPLAETAWWPDLNGLLQVFTRDIGKGRELTGTIFLAIFVGVIYHVVLNRTRFGFDLRASGLNPSAARAGGVSSGRMIILAMVLGGAVAGMVGMPEVLSDSHAFDQGFIRGLGFAGIAVALLGRNSAPGIALASLLFGFLDSSSAILQVSGSASKEIVGIMQAIILLAAVIAYEVVNRIRRREEVSRAARLTEHPPGDSSGGSGDDPTLAGVDA